MNIVAAHTTKTSGIPALYAILNTELLTRINLNRKKIPQIPFCSFCGEKEIVCKLFQTVKLRTLITSTVRRQRLHQPSQKGFLNIRVVKLLT